MFAPVELWADINLSRRMASAVNIFGRYTHVCVRARENSPRAPSHLISAVCTQEASGNIKMCVLSARADVCALLTIWVHACLLFVNVGSFIFTILFAQNQIKPSINVDCA
jgi:hypothetical protein